MDRCLQHRTLRAIIALLIIIGYVSVGIAAVSPGHLHSAQTPHSCAVCQVSLTPFNTPASGPSIWPPQTSDHGITTLPVGMYAGRQIVSGCSRAPPKA